MSDTQNLTPDPDRAITGQQCVIKHMLDRVVHQKPKWIPSQLSGDDNAPNRAGSSQTKTNGLENGSGNKETYLYLAYGSNLCDETFLGRRGIRPLSSINVLVPDLRMTFDLPGIPYAEPCFANSARRAPPSAPTETESFEVLSEKLSLLEYSLQDSNYAKDKWKKGLVGTVYEVSATDYAHIIATEGGGSAYKDILIDCFPLSTDPTVAVPSTPTGLPFKAHTLFAPAVPDDKGPSDGSGRFRRPDPSYAQASARYLKLITDGAAERKLPYEYQDYLQSLHPYTITTQKQRLGQFIFTSLWLPFIMLIFALQRQFSDDQGVAPSWLQLLSSAIFRAVWQSYDGFFRDLFGDGERTIEAAHEAMTTPSPLKDAIVRHTIPHREKS